MPDRRDNVLPFKRTARDPDAHLAGQFVVPSDVRELVSLMSDNAGQMSVVLTPVPDGSCAWEMKTKADVEQLGTYLIQLAAKMSSRKGPP